MTLNRKDIKAIRRMIRYEFKQALIRDIKIEKGIKPGTDNRRPGEEGELVDGPTASKQTKEIKNVNVLDWMVYYLPWVEGAHRGLQADNDKVLNKVTKMIDEVEKSSRDLQNMKQIFLAYENSMKKLVAFSGAIEKRMLEGAKPPQAIELKKTNESNS